MTLPETGRRTAPNISDVARLAGVSVGTVSNTLNNPSKVIPATRQRVMHAIESLGFVRNGAASSLAAGVSNTIGLVLVDLGNSLFLEMARGAERAAHRSGFNAFLADSDIDAPRQDAYLDLFDETRVAGVILAPLEGSLAAMDRVRKHGMPVVLLNYPADSSSTCSVVVDERLGGRLAANHLFDQGARRLAFAGRLKYLAVRERLEGARAAASERGLPIEVLETADLAVPHGREIGVHIANRPASQRPDGVVAGSDLLAVGIIDGLRHDPLVQVPRDIMVIGYDNNHFASDSYIPVSTIAQPAAEMGASAIRLVVDEARSGAEHCHEAIVLTPTLIQRQSSSRS